MTTTEGTVEEAPAPGSADELAERLFGGMLEAFELLSVGLGVELGLYRALAEGGPATPADLAARAGIDERYALEWLEQQATAGFLQAADGPQGGEDGGGPVRFSLPPGYAAALLDADDPAAVSSIVPAVRGIVAVLDDLARAYRGGGGVPFAAYGAGIRHGIGGMNRPLFTNDLPSWLGTVPGLVDRLSAPGARLLDVGCGTGWSTITLARTFPDLAVTAIDLDEASLADARANARAAQVADRIDFRRADAADLAAGGIGDGYDLACIFEALHDMAHPIEALRAVRGRLGPGGQVVVADERVADRFGQATGEFTERLMYAWSVLHCLPATMAEEPSVATGTVLRAPTLARYASEAGYRSSRPLPVENPFWRLYLLEP